MRPPALALILTVWAFAAAAQPYEAAHGVPQSPALTGAVYVRPLYGVFRHCGGACLKSGSLSWFCFEKQECYLSCATSPPVMRCATR